MSGHVAVSGEVVVVLFLVIVVDGVVGIVGRVVVVLLIVVMNSGVVDWGVVSRGVVGERVLGDTVLHLSAKEDLGEGETDGVSELIEVLVLPLGLSIHDLVVNILAVDNKIVLNVEDEVPRISEGLGHLSELVKIGADGGLALLELVGDVVNDVTEVLNSMEHRVEGAVLELVDNATEALPDVLGITEALNTVGNLSLNGASKETLEDLAHSEESEVDI